MRPRPMRPRVERVLPLPPEEVFRRVRAHAAAAPEVRVQMGQSHLGVMLAPERRRVFTPWLDLHVYPHPSGSLLQGRYAPHPHVWTLFMAGYGAFGFTAAFGLAFAATQWSLRQPPWALWLAAGGALGCVAVYLASFLGQRWGAAQMETLGRFLDDALCPDA